MSRYFTRQPVKRSLTPRSEDWATIGNSWHIPTVCDHEATDTCLLDKDGNTIWRAPHPMGFQWDK